MSPACFNQSWIKQILYCITFHPLHLGILWHISHHSLGYDIPLSPNRPSLKGPKLTTLGSFTVKWAASHNCSMANDTQTTINLTAGALCCCIVWLFLWRWRWKAEEGVWFLFYIYIGRKPSSTHVLMCYHFITDCSRLTFAAVNLILVVYIDRHWVSIHNSAQKVMNGLEPDWGADNDPEALGLAFHHQGPTFINACCQYCMIWAALFV